MPKKRKDGYIKISFMYEGKRYYAYGKTMKEARDKELKLREELAAKTYQKGKALTFSEYCERWYDMRAGSSPSGETLKQYRLFMKYSADTIIDKAGHTFGKLKLVDIEHQNVLDLQKAMKSRLKENGKPISTATVNKYITFVQQVFKSAETERIIQWNPAKGVKSLKRTEAKARETLHRALTREETDTFFKAAADDWYYPLFCFMISCGCRVGEAGALKLSDIKGNQVYINATITKDEIGGKVIGDKAKTDAGSRCIPYTKGMRAAVEAQKANNGIVFGNVLRMGDRIFKAPEGGLLLDNKVNEHIKKLCKATGIERFTSHAFRHTFATRALEDGMQPKTLSEILGHADISITLNLYAHVMEDTKAEEMKLVNVGI